MICTDRGLWNDEQVLMGPNVLGQGPALGCFVNLEILSALRNFDC